MCSSDLLHGPTALVSRAIIVAASVKEARISTELSGALIGLGGAVIGAVVALGTTIWSSRQNQVSQSADEFRDVVQKLVDLRIEWFSIQRTYADDPALDPEARRAAAWARDTVYGALNNKRQLHKATAARIMSKAADQLTPDDYVTLGFEYQADAELRNALDCYQRALARTDPARPMQHVNVLRSLGGLLLLPGTPLHNRSEAEGYLRDAISLTNGQTDDSSRYATGWSYEMLGLGLKSNRYPEWRAALQTAIENYEAMSPANALRQQAIDRVRFYQADGTPGFVPPSTKPPPLGPNEVAAGATRASSMDGG